MTSVTWLLVVVVVLAVGSPVAAETEATALLCQSNESAAVGYYHTELGSGKKAEKVSGPLERQRNTSQWRIDVLPGSPKSARVTRYSGTLQQIDVPASLWRIETDPMGIGLILLPSERAPGESPEVITITVATGAFVYSSQHVNPLSNRATVWVPRTLGQRGAGGAGPRAAHGGAGAVRLVLVGGDRIEPRVQDFALQVLRGQDPLDTGRLVGARDLGRLGHGGVLLGGIRYATAE